MASQSAGADYRAVPITAFYVFPLKTECKDAASQLMWCTEPMIKGGHFVWRQKTVVETASQLVQNTEPVTERGFSLRR